jgi:hypothetical protein
MLWENVVAPALVMAGVGLLILILLWPGPKQGGRVLARWGVTDTTDAEVADAVRYLKRRRLLYPWLYLGVSALASWRGEERPSFWPELLGTLVVGALLAELWAQRPSRDARRAAVLVPRRMRDLVSIWSTGAFAVLFVLVVGTSAAAFAGAGWARRLQPDPVLVLAGALLVGAIGWGIAWLAVRRPAAGEPRADDALRLRSARVAVGLAMAVLGSLFSAGGGSTVGLFVYLAGLFCWVATVNPPRVRQPGAARA